MVRWVQAVRGAIVIGADEFGPDFQRVLVRACVDDSGIRQIVRTFTERGELGFTDPASAWAWRVITSVERPTMLVLGTEARRVDPTDPARAGIQSILNASDVRDSEYATGQIVEWARRQLFATAFEESRQAWNANDFDGAMATMMGRITEIQNIQLEAADRSWFFEGFDDRQERRALVAAGLDTFPTGIDPIDDRMYGGLSYGELGVAVAYSKIGKSFWLNQVGFICSRMRRKCIHFVLEGGRAKCEDRYEARFMQTLYRNVRKGDIESKDLAIARREYDILKRNLVIRGHADKEDWHVTPDDLLAELTLLRDQHGWVPDMIVVDYGDLIHAPGDNERVRQKNAFRMLKTLAGRVEYRGHRGYAVWTASQAVRPDKGADEREHVVKPRDIADCYEKVRASDAILSLNITRQEVAARQARVFLGNYRDNEAGVLVRVQTDYDHGSFSVLGAPEPPPIPPPPKPSR
jgi:hypothetical protein